MVVELNKSLEKVVARIIEGGNFLLKGGAGSGKTYSLVDIVEIIYANNKYARIACITYTNAAVDVINSRYSNSKLEVSTIHTFLWKEINRYQKELKLAILSLIDEDKIMSRLDRNTLIDLLKENEITYGEYLSLNNGQISHDELIVIAEYLYKKYPLLGRVTKSKYDYILVDEYQDTHKEVMEIIFDKVQPSKSNNTLIIGLFGDEMQKIYDRGIDTLKNEWKIKEILKDDNYRSSTAIVERVNNRLRYDALEQEAVGDNKNHNSHIHFYYSANPDYKIDSLAKRLGWDDYRALYLTHRVLARNAGYEKLYALYDTPSRAMSIIGHKVKEQKLELSDDLTLKEVLDELYKNGVDARAEIKESTIRVFLNDKYSQVGHLNKRLVTDIENICPLLEYTLRIMQLKKLYDSGDIFHLISKLTDGKNTFTIKSHNDRIRLKDIFDGLLRINGNKSIGDLLEYAASYPDVFIPGDRYVERSNDAPALLATLSTIDCDEVMKLNETLEEDARHGTQHSAKGKAFDNVIVVLDNGNWYQGSNYTSLFKSTGYDVGTRRLIYTSCSRAIKNLAVFYFASNNDRWLSDNINSASIFFGIENTTNLDISI